MLFSDNTVDCFEIYFFYETVCRRNNNKCCFVNNQFALHKEVTEQHNRISGEHNLIWADRSQLKSCLCQVEMIRFYSGYYRLFSAKQKNYWATRY